MTAVLALLLTGCVTGQPRTDLRVPAVLDPLFAPCVPADGATTLQVYDDGKILGSGELEWLAKDSGDWDAELANSAGLTMLTINRKGSSLKATGSLATKAPKLAVRPDGFLEVDGHKVGLKASEVPCLLAQKLPRGWLVQLQDIETQGKKTTVSAGDDTRDITIVARNVASLSKGSLCTTVAWSRFLFFGGELTWCQQLGLKHEAVLTGVRDYSLKWVLISDGPQS